MLKVQEINLLKSMKIVYSFIVRKCGLHINLNFTCSTAGNLAIQEK